MRVAILRPRDRLEESAAIAREMGFEPVCVPSLEVVPEGTWLDALDVRSYDAVLFTSMSGVRAALDTVSDKNALISALNSLEVVSIGPRTTQELRSNGIGVDIEPEDHTSTGLVDRLSTWARGRKVLILRSDHGARELVTGLEEAGAKVTEVVVYRLEPAMAGPEFDAMLDMAVRNDIDAFAVTSALTARTFIGLLRERFGYDWRKVVADKVFAIGEPTRKALEEEGLDDVTVARSSTFRSLLEAVKSEK